ncbi:MAG: glutamate-5-semialdehyde dehydrogenase [Acholeplasmatales bacterium]|nr:glutamate-5-semialdehyde dehydrogenase [Acholeplasmatales bacterium]
MLEKDLLNVKKAQKELELLSNEKRNEMLKSIADALENNKDIILKANELDIKNAKESGLSSAMIERLTLNDSRIEGLIESTKSLISLHNYVGELIERIERPNGLVIDKVMVPFGVIAIIFESRPNVSVDIAGLCIKTANACVLKGGKEAINTNKALVQVMRNAIKNIVNPDVIYLVESTDRAVTNELITLKNYIDLLIPRGSKGLINYVVSNAKIPYIETGAGNCHLYVEKDADLDMALNIAVNAKYQRPSVCNAIENILVDEDIASKFLPMLYEKFSELKIEMRGCEKTLKYINVLKATDEDFYEEYNDYIVAIKVVKDIDEAINHINNHSTKHSEAIITKDNEKASKFMALIDSACVYHNASTRFTDGGCFGFGAEIGISTQKLHARGPMGLKEIMSYKYKIYGNGEVRK